MSNQSYSDFSLGYWDGSGWIKRKKRKNKKEIRRIRSKKRSSDFRLGFETGKADRGYY